MKHTHDQWLPDQPLDFSTDRRVRDRRAVFAILWLLTGIAVGMALSGTLAFL